MNNGKPLFYHSIGLPIEARSADNSEACYKKHTHEEFSVGIVEKGVSEYFNTGKKEEIGKGSTVIINPSDVHSCNPKEGYTWNYKMLFVDPQWLHCIQNEVLDKTTKEFIPFHQHHLINQQTFVQFKWLFNILVSSSSQLCKEQSSISFFSNLIKEDQGKETVIKKSKHNALALARDYIADNCEQNIKIDNIASAAGLSSYYLIHAFRKEFGMTPHAYQLARRINKAKTLLRYGSDIASVAVDLGFTDQSHFHRNFKQIVAATPKQYKDCFA